MKLLNKDGILYDETFVTNNPEAVVDFLKEHVARYIFDDYEHLLVVPVDSANKIIGVEHVSEGNAAQVSVYITKIFMSMLTKRKYRRMATFFMIHNHPSGSIEPSVEDIAITKKVSDASQILELPLLDHIIISARAKNMPFVPFCSIRRRNEELFHDRPKTII